MYFYNISGHFALRARCQMVAPWLVFMPKMIPLSYKRCVMVTLPPVFFGPEIFLLHLKNRWEVGVWPPAFFAREDSFFL